MCQRIDQKRRPGFCCWWSEVRCEIRSHIFKLLSLSLPLLCALTEKYFSGGESKDEFWRTVNLCTDFLPKEKPRYLMGVGFASDLVVCVALGIDMFDCVFPTRTAVNSVHFYNRIRLLTLPHLTFHRDSVVR